LDDETVRTGEFRRCTRRGGRRRFRGGLKSDSERRCDQKSKKMSGFHKQSSFSDVDDPNRAMGIRPEGRDFGAYTRFAFRQSGAAAPIGRKTHGPLSFSFAF
jgi:hypothetical protein